MAGPKGPDGYVVDFGVLKKILRVICKSMNEYLLVPTKSDVLTITEDDKSVYIVAEDGAEFKLPKGDCKMLPIVHTTAEELGEYITDRLVEEMGSTLRERRIRWTEVVVAERPIQEARYTRVFKWDDEEQKQD